MHAAIAKSLHRNEKEIIEKAFEVLSDALECNICDDAFISYVRTSYEDLIQSVKEYGVLRVPSIDEVLQRIAKLDENGEVEGLVNEVDIKEVNSDSDIQTLLNIATGELKLENSLTIFVGGQVLDRGITIPNMISFFYGRDPKMMQQDTVMQHCRMFGYRTEELLSVTRFYTTYRLFGSMKEITIRDNILRERMLRQTSGEVVYLEAGGKIKACSPQKILASEIHSILPEKRYLPVGFDIIKKDAQKAWGKIDKIIQDNNGYLDDEKTLYKKGQDIKDQLIKSTYCCIYSSIFLLIFIFLNSATSNRSTPALIYKLLLSNPMFFLYVLLIQSFTPITMFPLKETFSSSDISPETMVSQSKYNILSTFTGKISPENNLVKAARGQRAEISAVGIVNGGISITCIFLPY